MAPKIPVGRVAKTNQPVVDKSIKPKRWAFSFRFWRQREYFGLDGVPDKWFVSLIEKLKDFSNETVDEFLKDGRKKDAYRFHEISWTQKNIPVQRQDFNWIDSDYLWNEVDYPFYQFQISKALGRVVGFWDENQIFNILLLDPYHNIQPSKEYGYKVNPCSPLPSEYSSLIDDIRRLKQHHNCKNSECTLQKALMDLPGCFRSFNVVFFHLDDKMLDQLRQLVESGQYTTVDEVLQTAIEYL